MRSHPQPPAATGNRHVLSFDKLDPDSFERMCLWLVQDEGFERVQHLGASGNDRGIDILAWKDGEQFAFQCKRVTQFGPAEAKTEIDKILGLPQDARPHCLVFLVSCNVSATTREAAQAKWEAGKCCFWAVTELDERLKRHRRITEEFFGWCALTSQEQSAPVPRPPLVYAQPPYVSSHKFVGRRSQLRALDRWALSGTPPVILIDAIGGTGKSQLAWEWLTHQRDETASQWAGRYWYSFYEKGAVLDDFCRHALAYMTGVALSELRGMAFPDLSASLIHHLRLKPWLLVLDGLERVLVGYHRFDAALVCDDDASELSDQIASRDRTSAIREEDDELLRLLAVASPSKLLITTRLVPKILTIPAGDTIDGVQRITLPGLQPNEAESLMRSCGVIGTSARVRSYLKDNCGCHPLVMGVLAGLISKYLPDRGNFDAWESDPAHGGHLQLGCLELKQRRNHILRAALAALTDDARGLLSTLSLIYGSFGADTLLAFTPHAEPEDHCPKRERSDLSDTILELERSGLLQYDDVRKVYDLHPVVRHVVVDGMAKDDKEGLGQRVADYFSQAPHDPFENARSLEDVLDGLRVVRALLVSGQIKRAYDFYYGGLANALAFNMHAAAEALALIRPLFAKGWASPPVGLQGTNASNISNNAGMALQDLGQLSEAKAAFGAAVQAGVHERNWNHSSIYVCNLARLFPLSTRVRLVSLAEELASILGDEDHIFLVRLDKFFLKAYMGLSAEADDIWEGLARPPTDLAHYRPGDAEYFYALHLFWKGQLLAEHIEKAKRQARLRPSHYMVQVLKLEGGWHLEQKNWALAATCLEEALALAGHADIDSVLETRLATARLHLSRLGTPEKEFLRLGKRPAPAHRYLCRALADRRPLQTG